MEFKSNVSWKREIADSIRMAAIMLTGAFQAKYKQPRFLENAAEDSLYIKLMKMVDEGELGEAENYLWEQIKTGKAEDIQLALDIYAYMNDKEDDFLDAHNFTREEIQDGVQYVIDFFSK